MIKLTGKRVSATGFRIKMERKWKKYLLLYFIPTGDNHGHGYGGRAHKII